MGALLNTAVMVSSAETPVRPAGRTHKKGPPIGGPVR